MSFTTRKDNLAGNCILGTGDDKFYMAVRHPTLCESITALMNDDAARAATLMTTWKEQTARKKPPAL